MKATAKKRRFPLTPFAKLTPRDEPEYLVGGLIPREGLTLVWGPPKCGKSFWTLDVALHVALGQEYRGCEVSAGTVVYCAFEGASGFRKRVEAFRRHYKDKIKSPTVPFWLMPVRIDLINDHKQLIGDIEKQVDDDMPALVVLDTLNRSLQGSENSPDDMGAYVQAADAIREAFECAVVIVHHSGHDAPRPRGHSSLTAAVDAQLSVKRSSSVFEVKVEWMKDGEEDATVLSKLEVVPVGEDSNGKPITSCVVVPALWGPRQEMREKDRKAVELLKEGPLTEREWRTKLKESGIINPEAKNPRKAFARIKTDLERRNFIVVRDGMVRGV